MKLEKVKIKNFRSYKDEVIIPFASLTAFVGKNDIGKSTVLEALEIFFNGETKGAIVSCDKDDANVFSNDSIVEITCEFSDLPERIIIDACAETSLQDEYLVNCEGNLEIKKCYDTKQSKIKPEVYFVCNHPSNDNLVDLLSLKSPELKKRAQSLGIEKERYNASINSDIRRAIRESVEPITLEVKRISAAKEDAKRVYENVQKYLPMYALFQSDRNSTDGDREIMDPMKLAIKQALQEVDAEIEEIKKRVQEETERAANRTLDKLREMSPDLAKDLKPVFSADPKFDSAFRMNIMSDNDVPMNKRGSGVRRLLLLSFFRAEADRRMKETTRDSVIYAFEEPETSQHPNHQRLLVEAFQELSNARGVQIILTTHTPALAGMLDVNSLRLIIEDDEGCKRIEYGDDKVLQEICDSLGVLPEPIGSGAKALLLVEGHSDGIFVNHIANVLFDNGALSTTFEKAGFVVIPIGGCGSLKHWRNMKVVEKLDLPIGVLLDSDRMSAGQITDNDKEVERLKSNGIKAYTTRKREIENYIDPACVREHVEFGDYDDAKKIISDAASMRESNVIQNIFIKMSFDQIRSAEKYIENGITHFEFEEMFEDFYSLV